MALGLHRPSALRDLHDLTRLRAPPTHAAMERDHLYPRLADRDAPVVWAEKCGEDAWSRARRIARRVLETRRPEHLDPAQDAAIRAALPILP